MESTQDLLKAIRLNTSDIQSTITIGGQSICVAPTENDVEIVPIIESQDTKSDVDSTKQCNVKPVTVTGQQGQYLSSVPIGRAITQLLCSKLDLFRRVTSIHSGELRVLHATASERVQQTLSSAVAAAAGSETETEHERAHAHAHEREHEHAAELMSATASALSIYEYVLIRVCSKDDSEMIRFWRILFHKNHAVAGGMCGFKKKTIRMRTMRVFMWLLELIYEQWHHTMHNSGSDSGSDSSSDSNIDGDSGADLTMMSTFASSIAGIMTANDTTGDGVTSKESRRAALAMIRCVRTHMDAVFEPPRIEDSTHIAHTHKSDSPAVRVIGLLMISTKMVCGIEQLLQLHRTPTTLCIEAMDLAFICAHISSWHHCNITQSPTAISPAVCTLLDEQFVSVMLPSLATILVWWSVHNKSSRPILSVCLSQFSNQLTAAMVAQSANTISLLAQLWLGTCGILLEECSLFAGDTMLVKLREFVGVHSASLSDLLIHDSDSLAEDTRMLRMHTTAVQIGCIMGRIEGLSDEKSAPCSMLVDIWDNGPSFPLHAALTRLMCLPSNHSPVGQLAATISRFLLQSYLVLSSCQSDVLPHVIALIDVTCSTTAAVNEPATVVDEAQSMLAQLALFGIDAGILASDFLRLTSVPGDVGHDQHTLVFSNPQLSPSSSSVKSPSSIQKHIISRLLELLDHAISLAGHSASALAKVNFAGKPDASRILTTFLKMAQMYNRDWFHHSYFFLSLSAQLLQRIDSLLAYSSVQCFEECMKAIFIHVDPSLLVPKLVKSKLCFAWFLQLCDATVGTETALALIEVVRNAPDQTMPYNTPSHVAVAVQHPGQLLPMPKNAVPQPAEQYDSATVELVTSSLLQQCCDRIAVDQKVQWSAVARALCLRVLSSPEDSTLIQCMNTMLACESWNSNAECIAAFGSFCTYRLTEAVELYSSDCKVEDSSSHSNDRHGDSSANSVFTTLRPLLILRMLNFGVVEAATPSWTDQLCVIVARLAFQSQTFPKQLCRVGTEVLALCDPSTAVAAALSLVSSVLLDSSQQPKELHTLTRAQIEQAKIGVYICCVVLAHSSSSSSDPASKFAHCDRAISTYAGRIMDWALNIISHRPTLHANANRGVGDQSALPPAAELQRGVIDMLAIWCTKQHLCNVALAHTQVYAAGTSGVEVAEEVTVGSYHYCSKPHCCIDPIELVLAGIISSSVASISAICTSDEHKSCACRHHESDRVSDSGVHTAAQSRIFAQVVAAMSLADSPISADIAIDCPAPNDISRDTLQICLCNVVIAMAQKICVAPDGTVHSRGPSKLQQQVLIGAIHAIVQALSTCTSARVREAMLQVSFTVCFYLKDACTPIAGALLSASLDACADKQNDGVRFGAVKLLGTLFSCVPDLFQLHQDKFVHTGQALAELSRYDSSPNIRSLASQLATLGGFTS
jgi:hypothetical protein